MEGRMKIGPERKRNPQEAEAKRAGCTCRWWGRGSIVTFDELCPILELHRRPRPKKFGPKE